MAQSSGLRLTHCVQPPLAGDAFELAGTAVLELDPRAGDEIPDRLGDEYLAFACLCRDTRPGVHRDPTHGIPGQLHLARVQACADCEPDLGHAGRDRDPGTFSEPD